MSEVALPRIRGALISLYQFAVVIGEQQHLCLHAAALCVFRGLLSSRRIIAVGAPPPWARTAPFVHASLPWLNSRYPHANSFSGILFAQLTNYGTGKIDGQASWRIPLGVYGEPASHIPVAALWCHACLPCAFSLLVIAFCYDGWFPPCRPALATP